MFKTRRTSINTLIVLALIVCGIICVGLSSFFISSYMAIIGVTFIFWGALLLYVAPTKYVPLPFLIASTEPAMSNIERILSEFNFTGKGIYLPPRILNDSTSSLVFIPEKLNQGLPQSEEITITHLLNDKQDGLFLTPPGFALSNIFEQKMGILFSKIDVLQMQKKLSKLLTEDLGMMENLEIQINNEIFIFKITGNLFKQDCQETTSFSLAYKATGGILSSSLACMLAKVTGEPIVIVREEQSEDGKMAKIEFRVVN